MMSEYNFGGIFGFMERWQGENGTRTHLCWLSCKVIE